MPSLRHLLPCLFALLALPFTAPAQGVLNPANAPAPTLKTLAQIEPRTPIGTVGGSTTLITINQPGSYVLMGNLTVGNSHGISITTDNVTLDLNGFVIVCNHPAATTNAGIFITSDLKGIVIRNGIISSGTTYTASVFTPLGFGYGVYCQTGGFATLEKLSISGTCVSGIHVALGLASVSDCNVSTCATDGILANTVTNCLVRETGKHGIYAYNVVDACTAETSASTSSYSAIFGNVVSNSTGIALNGAVGLTANVSAINSQGRTQSGTYGLYAVNATNCTGQNISGLYGLYADSATNCRGMNSTGSYGLYADSANNCSAYNLSGSFGLACNVATTCVASSSTADISLSAYIAIGCRTAGGPVAITNKYNMP